MVELFLNYNCDYSNIFERAVQFISSTAKDKGMHTLADDDDSATAATATPTNPSSNFNIFVCTVTTYTA